MNCSACGFEVQRGFAFCPKCGANTSWVALPAFGALWDVIPGVTLFGSYMEGLEAGGTAPFGTFNANEILASAVSKQKEVGVRTSYFRGVQASVSLFDIDRANAVTDPSPNAYCGGHPLCFVNSGEINYKGLEATLNAELTRFFSVDAGWQWLRAVQNSPALTLSQCRVPGSRPSAAANSGNRRNPESNTESARVLPLSKLGRAAPEAA